MTSLIEKIEQIRRQPEHIRRRYAIGCLAVSMALVIGLWFLTVQENMSNAARDLSGAAQSGSLSPGAMPQAPSITDMLKQTVPPQEGIPASGTGDGAGTASQP